MKGDDELNTPMIAVVGAILVIFIFALIVAVQALFFKVQEDQNKDKYITRAPMEQNALIAGQQELLNSYRWIDKSHGVAGIPIDRAMRLVVDESTYGARKESRR